MSKINEKTGVYTGLVGTVIASSWKGIQYMKHKGKKTKKKPTVNQLQHRAKIRLIGKFIYSMKSLLDKSFPAFAIRKTGTNAAFSYNFKNCITGDHPSWTIDYSKVLVSRGDLPAVSGATAIATGNGEVQFNWTDDTGKPARAGDRCIGLLHCPEWNKTMYTSGNDSRGSQAARTSDIHWAGKLVHSWIACISADGKDAGESVYTGSFVIL